MSSIADFQERIKDGTSSLIPVILFYNLYEDIISDNPNLSDFASKFFKVSIKDYKEKYDTDSGEKIINVYSILAKFPSFRQSFDVINKKHKISSVKITLHNELRSYHDFSDNNEIRLSDIIEKSSSDSQSPFSMNQRISIKYIDSSFKNTTTGNYDIIAEQLLLVRKIEHDLDYVYITGEASDEQDAYIDIPTGRTIDTNKVIPMVLGDMKKSPVITEKIDPSSSNVGETKLIFDKSTTSLDTENDFLESSNQVQINAHYWYKKTPIFVSSNESYLPISYLSAGINLNGSVYGWGGMTSDEIAGDIRIFENYSAGNSFIKLNPNNSANNANVQQILHLNRPIGYTFHKFDEDNLNEDINWGDSLNNDAIGNWHMNNGLLADQEGMATLPFGGQNMAFGNPDNFLFLDDNDIAGGDGAQTPYIGTKRFYSSHHGVGTAYYVKAHFREAQPSFQCATYVLFAFEVNTPTITSTGADNWTTTGPDMLRDYMALWTGDTPLIRLRTSDTSSLLIQQVLKNPQGILKAFEIGQTNNLDLSNDDNLVNNSLDELTDLNQSSFDFTPSSNPLRFPLEGAYRYDGEFIGGGWDTISHSNHINFGIPKSSVDDWTNLDNTAYDLTFRFYNLKLLHMAVIPSFKDQDFYVDIRGRIDSFDDSGICTANRFIFSILKEMNLTAGYQQYFSSHHNNNNGIDGGMGFYDSNSNENFPWRYAATINKSINSKKLLEDFSKYTQYYIFTEVSNQTTNDQLIDSRFVATTIKSFYNPLQESLTINNVDIPPTINSTEYIINNNSIIDFSFSRTDIKEVYDSIEFNYNYDFSTDSYLKKIKYLAGDLYPNYSSRHIFGFNEDKKTKIVECEYIYDETTAHEVAKYMLGMSCLPHNYITLELTYEYIHLKIGDIVRINDKIQDLKLYGEDYHLPIYEVYGQNKYNLWKVIGVNINKDSIKINLYQLHEISTDVETTPIVYGCTDPSASNYDPNANYATECEYEQPDIPEEDIVWGCTNPDASNYNPEANTDDGSCEYPATGYCATANGIESGITQVNCQIGEGEGLSFWDEFSPENLHQYYGCTNSSATNYNPDAIFDSINGIGDPCEFPPTGLCAFDISINAPNTIGDIGNISEFDENGNAWNQTNCQDPNNVGAGVFQEVGSSGQDNALDILQNLYGCTSVGALNYDSNAQFDDNTCEYDQPTPPLPPMTAIDKVSIVIGGQEHILGNNPSPDSPNLFTSSHTDSGYIFKIDSSIQTVKLKWKFSNYAYKYRLWILMPPEDLVDESYDDWQYLFGENAWQSENFSGFHIVGSSPMWVKDLIITDTDYAPNRDGYIEYDLAVIQCTLEEAKIEADPNSISSHSHNNIVYLPSSTSFENANTNKIITEGGIVQGGWTNRILIQAIQLPGINSYYVFDQNNLIASPTFYDYEGLNNQNGNVNNALVGSYYNEDGSPTGNFEFNNPHDIKFRLFTPSEAEEDKPIPIDPGDGLGWGSGNITDEFLPENKEGFVSYIDESFKPIINVSYNSEIHDDLYITAKIKVISPSGNPPLFLSNLSNSEFYENIIIAEDPAVNMFGLSEGDIGYGNFYSDIYSDIKIRYKNCKSSEDGSPSTWSSESYGSSDYPPNTTIKVRLKFRLSQTYPNIVPFHGIGSEEKNEYLVTLESTVALGTIYQQIENINNYTWISPGDYTNPAYPQYLLDGNTFTPLGNANTENSEDWLQGGNRIWYYSDINPENSGGNPGFEQQYSPPGSNMYLINNGDNIPRKFNGQIFGNPSIYSNIQTFPYIDNNSFIESVRVIDFTVFYVEVPFLGSNWSVTKFYHLINEALTDMLGFDEDGNLLNIVGAD